MKTLVGSLLTALLVIGCALGAPADSPGVTPSPVPPTATTAPPTASPPPSPTPTPTEDDSFVAPPSALLSLPDGATQPARTGSYCYRETCSDSPYWPTAASMTRVEVPAGSATLSVTIPDGPDFVFWRARYAAQDDHLAETVYPLNEGGAVDGQEPMSEARFAPPPSGEWLLEVSVTLANEEGDVNYYWYVAVP